MAAEAVNQCTRARFLRPSSFREPEAVGGGPIRGRRHSMDEPVFFAEDSSEIAEHFDVPEAFTWVGSVSESEVDSEMPTIYLDWGVAKRLQFEAQRSIETDLEVAGILLGTRSADNSIIKVSHIAVARDEDSSPVHFKFTYSVWDDLIDQMDEMSQKAGEELLLLGWYHTHPNMAVFLSRYDLRTHRDFARPYQFALVLAPKAGTDQTAVGFFCNRGGGTPLLPGLRLYGVGKGQDVARVLPWGFQAVEAEGVYEGEGEDDDPAAVTVSSKPTITQLGVVRMEDPDWLTLGEDPSEGPVLPILESMAASVVETKQDRIAVLLGTKTKDNHITINRVRFLGTMGESAEKERSDILGALRFMAEAFPAHREQKILGVVRIVSPHRFRRGDAYDPVEHNIRIALLLGEVGYDLDQVPFQVGIALYPGIEADTLFFQVFAQHKTSRPVPLMSMRALAPPAMRANERYEPVDGPIFNVDEEPCHQPPAFGAQKRAADDQAKKAAAAKKAAPAPSSSSTRGDYVDPTTTGTDWDAIEDDPEEQAQGGVPLLLLGLGVVAVVILGALLLFLGGDKDGDGADPAPGGGAPEPVAVDGEPYEYRVTGCGTGWNPTQACMPLADGETSAPLVRVKRLPAYDAATFEPLEGWLAPKDSQERPKVRMDRTTDGGEFVFSVSTESQRWKDFWGDGSEFQATLVLLPRGAELRGGDEWEPLRRTMEMLLSSDARAEEPEDDEDGGSAMPPPVAGSAEFLWAATSSTKHSATYDRGRRAFNAPLYVTTEEEPEGAWSVTLRAGRRTLGKGTSDAVISKGSKIDVAPALLDVIRKPSVEAKVAALDGEEPTMTARIQPPGGKALTLEVMLRGQGKIAAVEHRVCVMAVREDGEPLLGAAVGETVTDSVGEFSINPKGGRQTFAPREAFASGSCGDGNGSRWAGVQFGGEPMQLTFRYTGSDESIAVRVPAKWTVPESSGLYEPGSNQCFTITVTLDAAGNQSRAPKVTRKAALSGGRCQ